VQRKETANPLEFADVSGVPASGRIVSIDPGTKFVGVAVSDETQLIARPLRTFSRTSWKKLLSDIKETVSDFDAVAVVVGLPLGFEGERIEMTEEAESIARRLSLSLDVPVYMQDERVTTYEARKRLWERGVSTEDTKREVDAEAAAVILSDFLSRCGR
jgi:putative Holliday junction resolvase